MFTVCSKQVSLCAQHCPVNMMILYRQKSNLKNWLIRPSVVAHTYNPSTLGDWGGWITWGQELRPAWPTWWNHITTKNYKISRVWWPVPEIPATQEAEAGELLEPGRRRLLWAESVPLNFSLGNKSETLSQKNKSSVFRHNLGENLPFKYKIIL